MLIATPAGIQLWAGRGDSARPVVIWKWATFGALSAEGSGLSSWIAVAAAGNNVPFELSELNNQPLAMMRMRGRARSRLIARLDELRTDPTKSTYKAF